MKKRYGTINVMKGLMQDLKDNQCYMWDKCRGIRMALTDRGYDLKYFF